MTLTAKEDEQLAEVVRPCFASLALANDYFSFDREWEISKLPGAPKPVNAVWHYMRWHGVDVPSAKRLARDAANRYEAMFLEFCHSFRMKHSPVSKKIDQYLDAIAHQVSGNVVWSLNCPRYHPEFRYDPNAGLEDTLTARHSSPEGSPQVGNPAYGELSNSPSSTQSTSDCLEADLTPASPLSTAASFCRSSSGITIPYNHTLGPEVLSMRIGMSSKLTLGSISMHLTTTCARYRRRGFATNWRMHSIYGHSSPRRRFLESKMLWIIFTMLL